MSTSRPTNSLPETDCKQTVPVVSVIIVSDYSSSDESSWDQLRRSILAVRQQDFDEPAEFLLIENDSSADLMPADIPELFPQLRIIRFSSTHSYALKNEGAKLATADLLAILDADCVPAPDWLRHLVQTLRQYPEAAAVNGTVTYPGRNLVERALGLLDRAYLNRARTGETDSLNNNSNGIRRSVLLQHPLPDNTGPFFNKMYAQQLIRLGHKVFFEPRMHATHDYEGWSMERDVRRNIGFATVGMRLADPLMPFAWLMKLRYAAIPLVVVGKTGISIWTSIRFASSYKVAWYQLPLTWLLAPIVHSMEIPGMLDAFRGRRISATAYR